MAEGLTQHVFTTQLGLQTDNSSTLKNSAGVCLWAASLNVGPTCTITIRILRYQQFSLKHSKSLACDHSPDRTRPKTPKSIFTRRISKLNCRGKRQRKTVGNLQKNTGIKTEDIPVVRKFQARFQERLVEALNTHALRIPLIPPMSPKTAVNPLTPTVAT